jgi:hypothetical protein
LLNWTYCMLVVIIGKIKSWIIAKLKNWKMGAGCNIVEFFKMEIGKMGALIEDIEDMKNWKTFLRQLL